MTEKKHFRRVFSGVPLEDVLSEVVENEELFGSFPIRTSFPGSPHEYIKDILLRGPEIRMGDSLEKLQNELFCHNYSTMDNFPNLYHAVRTLMIAEWGTALGRVIVTKLPPGGVIHRHKDEGDAAEEYDRYHIVLAGDNGNMFFINDEQEEMLPGDVWWVENTELHWVENRGQEDRIHIVCDIFRG